MLSKSLGTTALSNFPRIISRGVTVRLSCIERFTGKFQMELIIPIPLEWGLWSEQGTCEPI